MAVAGRRRRWADALPGALAFGVVLAVGLAGGGFFPRSWRLSTLALLSLAAAALVLRDRVPVRAREWAALGALAGLVVWTYASASWSALPDGSRVESERALLYAVGLATVLVAVSRDSLGSMLSGLLAGVTAVSGYALARHLISPPPLDPFQGANLHEPFGYSNAIGIFVVLGIVLAVGLGVAASTTAARLAALGTLVVLVPTLWLTSSRGAWLALPVGVAATLFGSRVVRPRLLLVLLGLGIAVAFALGSERGQPLTLFGENRPHYWRVAWQDVEDNPVLGSGAGTFGVYWLDHRPIDEFVHDAHSLFLETLAELGPPGLLLLVVALAAPLAAFARPRDRVVAAAAGAYVAFLLHAAIDWDWEFAAVVIVGLSCGGGALVGSRGADTRRLAPAARAALLVGAIVLAALVSSRLRA